MAPKIRNRWDRVSSPVDCSVGDRAKQSFKDECDVNNIMRRYMSQGVLPESRAAMARYEDFSSAPDFFEAKQIMVRAEEQFKALPAAAREKFSNNAGTFLAFIQDKRNYDEALKLGLLSSEAKPTPQKVPDVVVSELDGSPAKV